MSGIQKAHEAKAIHQQRPIPQDLLGHITTGTKPTTEQAMAHSRRKSISKHHIVMLESVYCTLPTFSIACTVEQHQRTSPDEVLARLRPATVAVSIMTPITPEIAAQCPDLQLIVVMATGYSWVDQEGLRALGVTVVNCPHSNIPAVSEHALGLYFAVRKRIPQLHQLTTASDAWAEHGSLIGCWTSGPPLSCAEEVVGIVGYGALGRRIEALMKGVGMGQVLVAERKGRPLRDGRVDFELLIEKASVLILCCPMDASTVDLVDEQHLQRMRKDAVVINVARGGVVNEAALVKALRERRIGGAATDVTASEPGRRGESPLLPQDGEEEVPNLVISPHVAWFASRTIATLKQLAKSGIESYVVGTPVNVVVDSTQ